MRSGVIYEQRSLLLRQNVIRINHPEPEAGRERDEKPANDDDAYCQPFARQPRCVSVVSIVVMDLSVISSWEC